ncbi:hypothetical protein CC1G_12651 [Coprinopsis cinerea okayama7|uniref:F-box domain-containing protein n=1 Tax=Coprinopsis cinerea (strain Okayama-7 / 130 / ATCC MYA-4618 / FGSC 9003) TaxID=240176 RepID=A8NE35_COPC7|nr:hypothetical protein CC1G_12651 [Coprinopsis cinerea okayama7\|eukprot:XP_001832937.2 hypothetical protein CC1G_12651 [Coprinopsis cinerea okayama7\
MADVQTVPLPVPIHIVNSATQQVRSGRRQGSVADVVDNSEVPDESIGSGPEDEESPPSSVDDDDDDVVTAAEPSTASLVFAFIPELFPFSDADLSELENAVPFPFHDVNFPLQELVDLEIDIAEFPFSEESEIDHGPVFTGIYHVWAPESIESQFPFYTMDAENLAMTDVIHSGNKASFYESASNYDFYRPFPRGETLRKLRTPKKDFIKVVPGSLRKLLDLPLELFFDILELFHPLDLLHLSRAARCFNQLLQTSRGKKVWTASYQNHPELPHIHESLSSSHWTAMLFDSNTTCDFCGARGALLDFAFNEHYCDSCQTKLLMEPYEVRGMLEDHPRQCDIILELLVPTYRSGGRRYQTLYDSEENARYRKKDVEEMLKTLTTWFITIDEGMVPEAGEVFEKWQQERIKEVQIIHSNAQRFNMWAHQVTYDIVGRVSETQRRLSERIANRLMKMGHDERDTSASASDIYFYLRVEEIMKLSSRIFEQHKAIFESKVLANKRCRLKKERKDFFKKVYQDYKKTLKPEKWAYLPPEDVVSYEDIFNDYIHQDGIEDLKELAIEEANAQLPQIIAEWIYQRRLELYELIPGVEMPQDPPEENEEGLSPEEIEKREKEREETKKQTLTVLMDQRMSLATSVFSCHSCKSGRHAALAIIGWDAACAHICGSHPSYFHTTWEFCSVGYAAAANIIRSLGLNPETATPEDLDKIDARFFCGNCPVTLHRKLRGRKAYTWRECVSHAVEKEEDHSHAIPAWLRLSDEATQFVKRQETQPPLYRKANWGCNHCPEHLEKPVMRKEAIEHVKKAHSIETPVQGTDFIDFINRFEAGGFYRRRHIFHYSIEPTCNLICKVCPEGKVPRMWTIQALVPHLFHRHGISMPSHQRDYRKIEVLASD